MKITRTILSLFVCVCAAFASATEWTLDVNPEADNLGYSDNAGVITNITSTFNTVTEQFTFYSTFDVSGSNAKPDGFWLAMNYGPNPKGLAGELALFYVDGFASGGPAVTAYAYNGKNSDTSWKDGDGNLAGNQAADKILSSKASPAAFDDITFETVGDVRTIGFSLDATIINSHSPAYPEAGGWTGVGFEDKVGIWFHPVDDLSTSYASDGFFDDWHAGKNGYFDKTNLEAVPEPATMAILAGLAFLRRKKAKKNAA